MKKKLVSREKRADVTRTFLSLTQELSLFNEVTFRVAATPADADATAGEDDEAAAVADEE